MSRILQYAKCENCGKEYGGKADPETGEITFNEIGNGHLWISFGHPDESFDYKWKCQKCEAVNVYHVEAWPLYRISDKI